MNKSLLILTILTLFSGFVASATDITKFEVSPDSPEESEEVQIDARATAQLNQDGSRPSVTFIRLIVDGERIDTQNCGGARGETDYSCSKTFSHSFDAGSREVQIYVRDTDFDTNSETKIVEVSESDFDGGDPEEFEVEDSNAEHIGKGEVEMNLEFGKDLPEDYSCRWSRNSDITISDQVMDRESDTKFKGSGSFDEGDHRVWMGCLVGTELGTEKVSESFKVDLGDLELSLKKPLNGEEINTPYDFRWVSSYHSESPTHTVYVKRHGMSGSLWDSRYREAYTGTSTSYWLERSLRSGSYDWGVEAEAAGNTERKRSSFVIPTTRDELDADFDYSPSNPEIGEKISFDASLSKGDIVDYEWYFGDDSGNSGEQVSHSYSSSGEYSVRLNVEDASGNMDSQTRTVRVRDGDRDGKLEVTVSDDKDQSLTGAKVTAMALGPSNFVSRSADKHSQTRSSSSSRVGDSEIGFELDERNLTTYAKYHSGYSRHSWNNLALESSDGDRLVFRYDLVADNSESSFREYEASQELRLSSGEREVTVILTLNGEKVDSFNSKITVPEDHEFAKKKESGSTSYEGRDRRTGNTPSLPAYTRYTDAEGETFFNLPADRYTVTATKTGYESDRTSVNIEENEVQSIGLQLDRLDSSPDDPEDSGDDEDDKEIERIEIRSISLPESVCRGEEVHARVTLKNTGTEDLDFALSATGLSSNINRIYYLEEGEKDTKKITFSSVDGDGNERLSFSTGYDSRERIVQVRECDKEETGLSASLSPTELRIGQSVRVSGIVEGTGRKEVDISIGGVKKQSVSTEPDGRFRAYVIPNRVGQKEVVVESEHMSRTRKINVLPTVNVYSVSAPDRAFEGKNFDICANIGSQTAPLVLLKKDGEIIESKNGRGNICFERRERPGNYEYEIQALNRGASGSASRSVEVFESDVETRSFPDQITSVRSGSGMVKVDLYNTQDRLRTYEVELEGLPRDWTSQSRKEVILDTGERKTEYIYFTPKLEGDFEATLNVRSDGEQLYSENIHVSSGGTIERESLWRRVMLWFRYG